MADKFDEVLDKLKARQRAAESKAARAEARAEQARSEHEAAMAALAELGFETVEEAEAEVARLEQQLYEEMRRVDGELRVIETPRPEAAASA